MTDSHHFLLFLGAALVLAITPGPGIFYVLARTLAGGRREGIQSSLGTFFGGLFHVLAAALGVSAILAASAVAFHTEVRGRGVPGVARDSHDPHEER
jgi:threonine/homoserine/homoserine lactone efflux protein